MKFTRIAGGRTSHHGFSLLELIIVMTVTLVIAVVAVPSVRNTLAAYRGPAAVQGIASQLSLTRMRAGARFTRTRLTLDTANNAYQRELYDKASSAYQIDGGVQPLANGVSFGFGNIAVPAGGQSAIQQSTQVIFNSRGIPVDGAGTPTGDYAVYVASDGSYFAVTINTAGQVRTWKYSGSAWVAQ